MVITGGFVIWYEYSRDQSCSSAIPRLDGTCHTDFDREATYRNHLCQRDNDRRGPNKFGVLSLGTRLAPKCYHYLQRLYCFTGMAYPLYRKLPSMLMWSKIISIVYFLLRAPYQSHRITNSADDASILSASVHDIQT